MPIVRLFVLIVCLAGAATALGAPSAFAANPSTAYDLTSMDTPFPQATGRFGERHAPARADIDGDGINDYFVGDLSEDVGAVTNAGRVYAISGADRTVIYSFVSPEPQAAAQFGFFIQVLGDVSGDGKPDIAVGTQTQDTTASGAPCTPPASPTDPPNGCNKDQGKVWVFSGAMGQLLYDTTPPPDGQVSGAAFGSRLGNAGDLTDDGVSELIAGATGVSGGRAYILNGRTGALVRTLAAPEPAPFFGLSVQGPGDVDGDGVTDQLVDAAAGGPTGSGRLYLFSGKTGAVLSRIDDPAPQPGAFFGFQDVAPLSPGDVNNDGRADLFANGFQQDGPAGEAQGRIWVFDGKASVAAGTGVVLFEPKDPTPNKGGQCCFSMDRTDYNQDGRPDLYVGASPHHTSAQPCPAPPPNPTDCGSDQSGGTYVFDGRDGSLLKALELPAGVRQPGGAGNLGSNLGWSAIAPGDLNRDGEPDYVAGATFQDRSNKDEGASFAFMSSVAAAPGGGGGGPAPPAPPKGKGCVNSAGVRVIGRTNSGGRVIQGTKGNDRICGTSRGDLITGNGGKDVISGAAGGDRINGGSGSDRINGGSGKDRISGGSGNEVISGSTGNDRINGNSGKDRVNGNSGNDRLNGSTGNDVVSGSSGRDIISGSSGNDRLSGNSGNDRINGNSGNDRISGGSGKDRLKGGSGNDRISGGSGRDRISGGSGRDKAKQ